MKNCNSHQQELNYVKSHAPLLRYVDGCDFGEWRNSVKEKLIELLGLPLEPCDPMLEVEHTEKRDGYTEYKFTVQTEPGYFVPCYLLVPDLNKAKYPLTVCLSGHGGGMHVAAGIAKTEQDTAALSSWHHRAMGPRAIKDGRAALVIEARNFGESSLKGYGTSCTEASKIAILMGRTTIGERVSDAMRILDAVSSYFDVIDMYDIACTGNSGGGTATYYLACLDERIGLVAPSCSICTYEASIIAMQHCMCNHIPGIRKYFEMGDLAGLIAPRKLIIAAGMHDDIFPIDATRENFKQIERIYAAAGVPDRCALVVGELGHLNYADLIWAKAAEMK